MNFLNPIFRGVSIEMPPLFGARGLTSRVLLTGLPIFTITLAIIFLIVGHVADNVMQRAMVRNAQMEASAISVAIEYLLRETRNQLLLLATGSLDEMEMAKTMKSRVHSHGMPLREISFITPDPNEAYLLIAHAGDVISVPQPVVRDTLAGPFQEMGNSRNAGHVSISRPMEVRYPLVPVNDTLQSLSFHVLRFSTPIHAEDGSFRGVLSLSLDLGALRDKLSFATVETDGTQSLPGRGRSFFFDRDGWMMFQAETGQIDETPLSSDQVRTGFHGDFGRPGFSQAFRPAADYLNYWSMVADIQARRSGMLVLHDNPSIYGDTENFTGGASYAPVSFEPREGGDPQVIGGIALLDNNFNASPAGRKLFVIYLCAFGACLALTAIVMYFYSRNMARNLGNITAQIDRINAANTPRALDFPGMPMEFEKLKDAINVLMTRLKEARDAEQCSTAARMLRKRRQAVSDLPASAVVHATGLVGESPQMQALYTQIEKAAQVSADVLVLGETGTGKELVSLSIHNLSVRRSGPFISINCGALDEALLMDTLFGHVKGAFTEAKTDRKGAFLAAKGGTLLLDEIGNAPIKVQQALLRALSTRRIRPLGSDEEIGFDARIIAATNSPIRNDRQDFRNDLYYRLAVITLETPPLRAHKDDIYHLLPHFLGLESQECGFKTIPALSYGALEKLLLHDWPGNVREFRNTITRALAFCDGKMIMADDFHLSSSDNSPLDIKDIARSNEPPASAASEAMPDRVIELLNERQKAIWPELLAMAQFSREEYQKLAGENISRRTAQYDLQIMVRLGLLTRSGKGPQQRYATCCPATSLREGEIKA